MPQAARAATPQVTVPTQLLLSTVPSKLPADNNSYPDVVVSVADSAGQPTAAVTGVNVSLTSSQQSVGTIAPMVFIAAGQTYAIANFTTTHTAGSTTVTATTTGLATASTVVSTVIAVGYPTRLVMYAVPSSIPAQPSNTGSLILELQDDVGLPAKAIYDTPISLYSSNVNVVNMTESAATMNQGQYLMELNYTSGYVPGSAELTASASGFGSGVVTVNVLGQPPLALKLDAQPDVVVTCGPGVTSCSGRLVVALTDLGGNPTLATRAIVVQLRSSNLAAINTSETAVIEAGNISAIAAFDVLASSVPTSGLSVEITASAPGLSSAFATISIKNAVSIDPSACTTPSAQGGGGCFLSIFAGPNPVLADHRSYSSVVVALEATIGQQSGPAVNSTGATQVTLTSSVTGVGNFTRITFTIPEGQNWASVTFTSTFQVGTTQLTASAQNMLPIQTSLETFGSVPSNVVVTPISPTLPADGQSHPALELSLEDAGGSPAIAPFNIPVNLTSSQGGIVAVSPATIPSGASYTIVNVTSGILQGTANVTALVTAFTNGTATSSTNLSTVIPAPSAISAVAPDGNTVIFTSGPNEQPPAMAVQLQDSSGNPARARAPMNITITSSNSTVISSVLSAAIGVGGDYSSVPLAANVPGTTTLTLSSQGLSTAKITITFLPFPGKVAITGGPTKIFTNQTAVISVSVNLDGVPVQSAPVNWNASSGGLVVATPHISNTSSTTTTESSSSTRSTRTLTAAPVLGLAVVNDTTSTAGSSTIIFHPRTPGSVLITAEVEQGGILAKTLNFTVQVSNPPVSLHPKAKLSMVQELVSFPMVLVPVGGAGGAGAAAFLVLRRRKGGAKGDQEFDTSFE